MFYLYGCYITNGKKCDKMYIEVDKGKISYIGMKKRIQDAKVIDIGDHIIAPGYVDIHIHGVSGYDFTDGGVFSEIATILPKLGVTSFLATSRTAPVTSLKSFLTEAKNFKNNQSTNEAKMLGVHIEGPWISHEYKGAQPAHYISKLTHDVVEDVILPNKDIISKITLAPETLEDLLLIKKIRDMGIFLSAGHTNAPYHLIKDAMKLGLTQLTHTFNAMSTFHHREPGAVLAALEDNDLICELITDGIHINDDVLRFFLKHKRKDKVALISDCTGYNHLSDGEHFFREKHLVKQGNRVMLKSGQLTGSALTLDKGVQYVVNHCDVSLEDAIFMATTTPINAVNTELKIGHIKEGYHADLIILDSNLNVQKTFISGVEVFSN
ncbi:N-acetylglucosamine-6-phosphate deacetylase [Halolactibacillus alkaliphilus]|uniref:N-acetylglucosamine-6-phosphate deacetylase n=1 Tax=Halolactibacillus alkaliphilus TaxID=442899 RepID=A0A511WZN1_9BACI|nr:N-acetylglucosamine-6-phosphate deacetylase [Halolactibacillus alkaliphilus]GEN56155.1 N-acetylglucosamine-6-phosphate deacetylase [Halolactibacillus alkaliphilus]GGN66839.1 N-acetylglucosamine-6-phosphate deacetylase [Halolactibacillus alkaliphilus]SFO72009.1 N-acetylglucosamine-6-phosphate deacetylase [Halolactibacillus alkaliphilus]